MPHVGSFCGLEKLHLFILSPEISITPPSLPPSQIIQHNEFAQKQKPGRGGSISWGAWQQQPPGRVSPGRQSSIASCSPGHPVSSAAGLQGQKPHPSQPHSPATWHWSSTAFNSHNGAPTPGRQNVFILYSLPLGWDLSHIVGTQQAFKEEGKIEGGGSKVCFPASHFIFQLLPSCRKRVRRRIPCSLLSGRASQARERRKPQYHPTLLMTSLAFPWGAETTHQRKQLEKETTSYLTVLGLQYLDTGPVVLGLE